MRQDSKDTTEKDDIDRLFAMVERDEPPPGNAFKSTLDELRQKQAKPVARRNWRRVAQFGLAIAAVLALAVVAVSALILSNNSGTSGSLASNITTVAAITAETTTVVTTTQATTAAVVATTTAQPAVTTERTQVVNAQTPDPAQSETTVPDTTTSEPTSAAPVNTTPQPTKPIRTLETPVVITVTPTVRPTFLSVGGKVTAYDKGSGIITLNATTGKTVSVKLGSNTVVSRKSVPSTAADITVGATLTAEGSYNAQNQLEATAIILDIQSSSQPIGDPGYPNEKG